MSDPLRPTASEAAEAWAARVRANREQVERFREAPDGDFYGPISGAFRDDPRRTDDAVLDALVPLARENETWLDIGAGGGRYALPLALHTREVIAVEPSEGMLGVLRESAGEHGITNVREVAERWPGPQGLEADVSLIANVGMDIEDFR
ncbi:MAG: methyltransferase domain-containing protein [Dehalococcoidia bacterium]|nr:methyltransferase domain-containing protein [Dehalococcoidia bacterium]